MECEIVAGSPVFRLPSQLGSILQPGKQGIIAAGALVLGLAACSLSPILIRLGEVELSPHATIFHRSWMAMLIFIGWEWRARRQDGSEAAEQQPDWQVTAGLLLALGVTFAIAVVAWAWSLTETTVANSSLLHSFTPLFTGLFAWLIWGQRFGLLFWLGMSVAMGGALFLGVAEYGFNPEHLRGDAASLFSALFFSPETVLIERLRQRLGTPAILAWCFGTIAVLILPFLWVFPSGAAPTSARGWATLLTMAIVCQGLGFGLLTYCLKYIAAGVVSLAHLLMPLLSAGLAWPVFGEPITRSVAVAFVVVLGGIVLGVLGTPPNLTSGSRQSPLEADIG